MKRSQGIDLLRGLCILAVVIHHINIRIHLDSLLPQMAARALFWSGSSAVKVFFAISSFLITKTIQSRWGGLDKIDVARFYRLRFARIAPCLIVLVAVLSALHLFRVPGFVIEPARTTLPRAVVAALTFHVNWLEPRTGYLPGAWDILWSLSVEEAFYLFYPLLCRYAKPRWVLPALAALLILAGPFFRTVLALNAVDSDYAFFANMDGIAIGCLATLVPRVPRRLPALLAGSGMMLLILVFRRAAASLGLYSTGLDVTVLEFGAALVILSISSVPFTRPVRWYGRNSYEVYLTHMFVVTWGIQLFASTHAPLSAAPWWFAGMVALAGLLGHAVSRFFSEPLNRRLRERSVDAHQYAVGV